MGFVCDAAELSEDSAALAGGRVVFETDARFSRAMAASHETGCRHGCGEGCGRDRSEDLEQSSEAGGLEVKYAVIYEPTPTGYSAFVPDLPGYAAAARNVDELRVLVREGIPFHLDGLRQAGVPVPRPGAIVDTVEVA